DTSLAITGSFEAHNRTYLQAADGTIVPAERMRLFQRSAFAGVRLQNGVHLPLGWAKQPLALHQLEARCHSQLASMEPTNGRLETPVSLPSDCWVVSDERLALREAVALSGRQVVVGSDAFVETRLGTWVRKQDL